MGTQDIHVVIVLSVGGNKEEIGAEDTLCGKVKHIEDIRQQEAAINEYLKPVDKQAEMIVEMQLKEEEKTMKQMMQAMKEQALLNKEESERNANLKIAETKQETHPTAAISKARGGQ
nr:hypothetical protein [Tanacetum cinerariifolium]